MKKAFLTAIILLGQLAYAGQGDGPGNSDNRSLNCRLSHNLKNYDFQIATPKMEEAFGSLIGDNTVTVQAGAAQIEAKLSFIEVRQGGAIAVDNSIETPRSISLDMTVLTGPESLMPYKLKASSTATVENFSKKMDISVSVDLSPLGFDQKYNLWCQTAKIK